MLLDLYIPKSSKTTGSFLSLTTLLFVLRMLPNTLRGEDVKRADAPK